MKTLYSKAGAFKPDKLVLFKLSKTKPGTKIAPGIVFSINVELNKLNYAWAGSAGKPVTANSYRLALYPA